jgi:hypothetical protein
MRRYTVKKLTILLLISTAITGLVFADADGHGRSVTEVLDEIRAELGIDEGKRIPPDAVSPALLEELGDAVMAEIHPDPEVHAWMDQMMGGEGSESLASAHRWMGYRYLTGGYGRGFGMMGGGMMGPGMMGRGMGPWGVMGNPNVDAATNGAYDSPEEIAKRRYARGEISREEYLQLMEDLSHSQ